MLSKLKVAIVLLVIGAVSGFLIWGTNELTYEDIIRNREIREQGYYKELFELDESATITFDKVEVTDDLEEIVIYDQDGVVVGYIYKSEDTNSYGDVVVLMGVRSDGTISNVIISSTTNTPTYVKNIRDNYLEPFSEQDASSVEFDSSTGASFTYGSVTKIVKSGTEYYEENRGDE